MCACLDVMRDNEEQGTKNVLWVGMKRNEMENEIVISSLSSPLEVPSLVQFQACSFGNV